MIILFQDYQKNHFKAKLRSRKLTIFGSSKQLVDTGDFSWNTLIDKVIEWQPVIKQIKEKALVRPTVAE